MIQLVISVRPSPDAEKTAALIREISQELAREGFPQGEIDSALGMAAIASAAAPPQWLIEAQVKKQRDHESR